MKRYFSDVFILIIASALVAAVGPSSNAEKHAVKISVGMPVPFEYERQNIVRVPNYVIAPVPAPVVFQQPARR